MTAPDLVDPDRERYYKSQQRAQARARQNRLAMTLGKGAVLAHLDPKLHDDQLTPMQVTAYLGISRGTLNALVRIHNDELREAGYTTPPGAGSANAARFSRRAVLHLAMLLRPNASEQAVRIKKALGIEVPVKATKSNRWASHVNSCRTLVEKAAELAEAVQDLDPQETWNDLSQMDRWQLQGLVVALGAMVPLEEDGAFAYLAKLGDKVEVSGRTERADYGKHGHVSRGLASLIPCTRAEYEANEL